MVQSHKLLFALFLVFGLIGMIRDNGPVEPGDLFLIHVNAVNEGDDDFDDMSVKVLIYDLGVVLRSNFFDLKDGDTAGNLIFWDVPAYVKPGNYWARITLSNDDVREVKHRTITVV